MSSASAHRPEARDVPAPRARARTSRSPRDGRAALSRGALDATHTSTMRASSLLSAWSRAANRCSATRYGRACRQETLGLVDGRRESTMDKRRTGFRPGLAHCSPGQVVRAGEDALRLLDDEPGLEGSLDCRYERVVVHADRGPEDERFNSTRHAHHLDDFARRRPAAIQAIEYEARDRCRQIVGAVGACSDELSNRLGKKVRMSTGQAREFSAQSRRVVEVAEPVERVDNIGRREVAKLQPCDVVQRKQRRDLPRRLRCRIELTRSDSDEEPRSAPEGREGVPGAVAPSPHSPSGGHRSRRSPDLAD